MKKIVVDTSVLVKWVNRQNEKYIDQADLLLKAAEKNQVELFAPELSKYEVGNVLLKGKKLTTGQANQVLTTIASLPITFIPESLEMAKQTFSIASKNELTYYDAAFLATAKYLDAELVTDNFKHQGRVKGQKVISLVDIVAK